MELLYSELESRRFGLCVYRVTLDSVDPATLRQAILEQRADLVICRIPASALPSLTALGELGMPVVVADTLVHYWADLTTVESAPLRNSDLEFVEAGSGELERLVRIIFSGYSNHYHANPILPHELILEGYVEWALGFIGQDPSMQAWVVRRRDDPVAFATCRFAGGEAHGVLYGVVPAESGRGVYRDLIRFTARQGRDRGCRQMHTSTQVQNFPVQAVWVGEGFRLRAAEVTFHVNALLTAAGEEQDRTDLVWGSGNLPGDGPAAEALLVDGVAARFFRDALPGRRSEVRETQHCAVRPLRSGERYRISFGLAKATGHVLATVQVADETSRIHHQAYYHLGGAD